MLFNQWSFLVFFVVVYGAYVCLKRRPQNVLLLGASYVYYAFWDWRFVGLLLASTVTDYWIGIWLGEATGNDPYDRFQACAVNRFDPAGFLVVSGIC